MKRKSIIVFFYLMCLLPLFAQSNKDYKDFIKIIKSELKEIGIKNYEDHFDEQYFIIKEENDYFEVGTQAGVTNLYNICIQNDKNDWKDIVKSYFAQVKETRKAEKEIIPKLQNFDTGKEYLKIRVYPNDYKEQLMKSAVVDISNENFISVVVIDFPSGIKSLSKEYLSIWSIEEKEVLKNAIENTLKNNNESFETFKISENFSLLVMLSDDNIYVTSSIYNLREKNKNISKYGAFVAIPNRLGILLKNIEKETINADIIQMISLANYMYQQGPGSISDKVFWFDGTNLYKIIHDPSKGMIKLPDELVNLLKE